MSCSIYLPKLEMGLYFSGYILSLVISIKDVLPVCTSNIPGYLYFDNGWDFLKKRRDNTDFEWETWHKFVAQYFWIFIVHSFIMEILRFFKIKKFSLASLSIGLIFLTSQIGIAACTMVLTKTLLFYWVSQFRKKYLVWLMVSFWMAANNLPQTEEYLMTILGIEGTPLYMLYITLGWNTLKCVSFAIDKIEDGGKGLHYGLVDFLGYVFYTPTIFMGPVVIFERHRQMLLNYGSEQLPYLRNRFWSTLKSLLKCYVVFLFSHAAMHFLYVNNFQYFHSQILPLLSAFGLYGYGYLMGQFFHAKYVIFYGIGIALGKFDNIQMPLPPRCIARTHKYTDMWKYFDHGLYEFLFRYIYTQLCKKRSSYLRRLGSVLVTFVFIYLWHGIWMSIFVWSALNFVCVLAENILTAVFNSKWYMDTVGKYLSSNNVLRLNALISTNVMIPSILSNFVFFAGTDVGYEFFKRTYTSGFKYYVNLLLICYCLYNSIEWICRAEKKIMKLNQN